MFVVPKLCAKAHQGTSISRWRCCGYLIYFYFLIVLFYFFSFLLTLLGWHWVTELHRFQVHSSTTCHLYPVWSARHLGIWHVQAVTAGPGTYQTPWGLPIERAASMSDHTGLPTMSSTSEARFSAVIKSKYHAKTSVGQEVRSAEFSLIPRSEELSGVQQVSNSLLKFKRSSSHIKKCIEKQVTLITMIYFI